MKLQALLDGRSIGDFVFPACPESFLKKDPEQVRMIGNWKDSRRAGVTKKKKDIKGHLLCRSQ